MLRLARSAAVIAVASLTLGSGPLDAQSYRNAIGLVGGGTWTSGLAPDAAADPQLPVGWNGGIEVERWLGDGRFGLRLNGTFSEVDVDPWTTDTNIYTAGVGLMMRLLAPRDGRIMAPFISLGGSGVHYNFSDVQHFDATPSDPDVLLRAEPITRPAVTAGLGFDLAPGTGVGLRFEGVDRLTFQSPFVDGDGTAYGMVHHLRYSASLQLRFGRLPQAAVLAAAPPSTEAPPEPEAEAPIESRTVTTDTSAPEPPEPPAEPEPDSAVDPRGLPTSVSELRRPMAEEDSTPADTAATQPDRATEPMEMATDPNRTIFTVQIAAYEAATNARQLAERMRRNQLPAWVTQVQRAGRVYHRVRVGAVPSEPEARQLGQRLRAAFNVPVWVVQSGQSAEVPESAIRATRSFIQGS